MWLPLASAQGRGMSSNALPGTPGKSPLTDLGTVNRSVQHRGWATVQHYPWRSIIDLEKADMPVTPPTKQHLQGIHAPAQAGRSPCLKNF